MATQPSLIYIKNHTLMKHVKICDICHITPPNTPETAVWLTRQATDPERHRPQITPQLVRRYPISAL